MSTSEIHTPLLKPDGTNDHFGFGDVPEWTLGDRMRRALRHSEFGVADMAIHLEVSLATIGRWLNDRGPVRRIYLRSWAELTGVSLTWLETGEAITEDHEEPGELRARRDSNPQPSDLEPVLRLINGPRVPAPSTQSRPRLVALPSVQPDFTPDRRTA